MIDPNQVERAYFRIMGGFLAMFSVWAIYHIAIFSIHNIRPAMVDSAIVASVVIASYIIGYAIDRKFNITP